MNERHHRIADIVCREVCELSDRTSDQATPDVLMVSYDELRHIVLGALQSVQGQVYPPVMTKALGEVLGMMVFELSPIAHGFRSAGFQIEPKVEIEQAFVLHWLIQVALEHGDGWRKVAGARLAEVIEQAKAREIKAGTPDSTLSAAPPISDRQQ